MSTVANAYGNFLNAPPPFFENIPALGTPFGTVLKPGGKLAAYVRSTGVQDGDDDFVRNNLVTSINEALKRCRSGKPDLVLALNGHTESVASADAWSNLVAGAQIISCGIPGHSSNPTLTWNTSTAAQVVVDVADVTIAGFNMNWASLDNVVLPITVSAQGFTFANNEVEFQNVAAAAQPVDGIALAAGANYCKLLCNNFISGDNTDQNTGSVIVVGTAGTDALKRVDIIGNYILASTPGDTDGLIEVVTNGTGIRILHNTLHQLATTGDAAINAANVTTIGEIAWNSIRLTEDLTAPNGIILAGGVWLVHNNKVSAGNGFAVETPATDS